MQAEHDDWRDQGDRADDARGDDLPGQAGQHHDQRAGHQHQQRRAQVRLLGHQGDRGKDQPQRPTERPKSPDKADEKKTPGKDGDVPSVDPLKYAPKTPEAPAKVKGKSKKHAEPKNLGNFRIIYAHNLICKLTRRIARNCGESRYWDFKSGSCR